MPGSLPQERVVSMESAPGIAPSLDKVTVSPTFIINQLSPLFAQVVWRAESLERSEEGSSSVIIHSDVTDL